MLTNNTSSNCPSAIIRMDSDTYKLAIFETVVVASKKMDFSLLNNQGQINDVSICSAKERIQSAMSSMNSIADVSKWQFYTCRLGDLTSHNFDEPLYDGFTVNTKTLVSNLITIDPTVSIVVIHAIREQCKTDLALPQVLRGLICPENLAVNLSEYFKL